MFRQLDLKCFRQHEDLTINFEPGVVAIRGRNEKGKTTVLEAMAYALFGATSLREPLEDVVTWGKKPGDLKVKLGFQLNGVDYTIHRSKSGAEIKSGERILATGQKEVTKYVETLLGASQDVCTKLMLASQEDIKGALSKGPSAAIELIEALSNLGVIDTIIGLVQGQLPGGATTAVAARIQTLEQQVAVPVQDDTQPLRDGLAQLEEKLAVKTGGYNAAKDSYTELQPAAIEAQAAVNEHERLTREEVRLKAEKARAEVALTNHVVPALPTNIEQLRQAAQDASFMARAASAATALERWKKPDNEWEGDHDSLLAELASTNATVAQHAKAMTDCTTAITKLEAQKITQTACGLCGKDLSKVPEVVTKNVALDGQIAQLMAQHAEASEKHAEAVEYRSALTTIQMAHLDNMRLLQTCRDFVTLDEGYVPPRWEWSGPAEITTSDDAPARLAAAEREERAHHAAVGKKQQLEEEVRRCTAAWQVAVDTLALAAETLGTHRTTLEQAAAALIELNARDEERRNAQQAVQTARHALEVAEAGVRERQAARKALESQLQAARKELAEMDDNNALVKFLREARPIITDQLWGLVTATVSDYFSEIRGTQSVVTRSDNGFKVDGHNVAGLSGSTKDALGLAIRKALTKTFLPNASFMVLDEPGAAMDDERESNMLGLVAAGGFEQVILVTHSELCDAFASQLVQL